VHAGVPRRERATRTREQRILSHESDTTRPVVIRAKRLQAAVLVVLLAVALACTADPKVFLWIPPEATILRTASSHRRGHADVAFTVPLSDLSQRDLFIARLSLQLEQNRWRRRSHQYLNPTHATSFEEGWKRQRGGGLRMSPPIGAPKRNPESYRWDGEWDDAEGNVIGYHLFAYHLPEGLGAEIRSYAAYVPVKLVLEGH
jgi:hypothetical protein